MGLVEPSGDSNTDSLKDTSHIFRTSHFFAPTQISYHPSIHHPIAVLVVIPVLLDILDTLIITAVILATRIRQGKWKKERVLLFDSTFNNPVIHQQ
jgi:hypothetical protein